MFSSPRSNDDPSNTFPQQQKVDRAFNNDCDETIHFHRAEDLHSYLIRSWSSLSPSERSNNLILSTKTEDEAARAIVVLVFLESLSRLLDSDLAKAQSLIFPVLYYFSLGEVMPGLIALVLEQRLRGVVDMLSGDGLLPGWLVVSETVKEEVLGVVREWVERMSSGSSVKEVRRLVVQRFRRQEDDDGRLTSPPQPLGCEKEVEFHRRFGVLTMNWASHELFYEEELQRAYAEFDPVAPGSTGEEFLEIVDAEWRVNPALIEADCLSASSSPLDEVHLPSYKFRHSPASFARDIVDRGAKAPEDQGLMEYVSYWFNGVAHAIAGLRETVTVEVAISKP